VAFGASLVLAALPATALAGTGNVSGTLHDDDTGGAAVGVLAGGLMQDAEEPARIG